MSDARDNKATKIQAAHACEVARAYLATALQPSSAQHCLDEAERFLVVEGRPGYAHEWALQSLAYSGGVFHATYRLVETSCERGARS